MSSTKCIPKLECDILESDKCNPNTLIDFNSVLNWFTYDCQTCNINYLYINSNKDINYSSEVKYKKINDKCYFYFTTNKELTVIYVYLNLFNDFNLNNNAIGHHITIMNYNFNENNKNKLVFHSTIYNPTNFKLSQYTWFKVENNKLINITENGDTNEYTKKIVPMHFLKTLWNNIKCSISNSQVKLLKPSFASICKNKIGGNINIIKFKNNKNILAQIIKIIKKEKYENIQIFKNNNKIILIKK